MSKATQLHGDDIPLAKLRQSRKRKIDKRYGQRIKASINNVGLIEPLVVCKDESGYVILDGNYRYELLLEMGFETAPCFIVENYDLYTMNRQVNHVSPLEEAKMIQKASEVVGEKQIAAALGLKSITRRLTDSTKSKLHADVLKAYDNGTLGQSAVKEMAHVV
ncbi:MAG: ParB/RepB/Spo0J family partition protein, partial [Thermoguttaceae bacterium]